MYHALHQHQKRVTSHLRTTPCAKTHIGQATRLHQNHIPITNNPAQITNPIQRETAKYLRITLHGDQQK